MSLISFIYAQTPSRIIVDLLSDDKRVLIGGLHETCHGLEVTREAAQLLGMIVI
jgi:hypothetical protein